jgi:hypothetical protein
MSEANWNSVIALVGVCFTGYLNYLVARLNRDQNERADEAERKTEQVRATLVTTTGIGLSRMDALAVVAKATHTLVNSSMGVQLELNRMVTRRLANLTHDPEDLRAADLADSMSREHEARQRAVDLQPGTESQKKGDIS